MSLAESEGPCLTNNKNRDNEVAPKTGSLIIIMQEPAEETEASIPTENVGAEASIPTENVEEDPNLNVTFPVRRKAAKRTLPWDLKAGELNLMPSLSSPQAEDIPATKKPRLEKPFSATADDATSPSVLQRACLALTIGPTTSKESDMIAGHLLFESNAAPCITSPTLVERS
jgi:hypothetical protein